MAILVGANLSGARFAGTFHQADFSGADLRGATFVQSIFGFNDFSGADLTGANFTNSIMSSSKFEGATCPDGSLAESNGGTCIGTPGLRNLPTTRSLAEAVAMAGKPAPEFNLVATDDPRRVVRNADFSGKPLVLVWTASWCYTSDRCMQTFREVNAAALNHPDVAFVAVSLDRSVPEAVADAASRGFVFPVAIDTDMAASNAYHIIAPGLFTVIAPDGTVAPYANATGQALSLELVLALFR